jgi:hypothetical protein
MSRSKFIVLGLATVLILGAVYLQQRQGSENPAPVEPTTLLADPALAVWAEQNLPDVEVTVLESGKISHELRFNSYDLIWTSDIAAQSEIVDQSDPQGSVNSVYTLEVAEVEDLALYERASGAQYYIAPEEVFQALQPKRTEQEVILGDKAVSIVYREADYRLESRMYYYTKKGQNLSEKIAGKESELANAGWRGADRNTFNTRVSDHPVSLKTE